MRACLIPMAIQPGKRSANLGRALDWMEQVADLESAPDLIVFPEGVDWGLFQAGPDPNLVEPRSGPFVESLADRARGLGIYVAAGVTELEDGHLFSCAVLIDPDGDTILRHRRITVGQDLGPSFSPGTRLQVRETPLGRCGLLVGDDVQQAPLVAALGLMGADFIIAPAGLSAGNRPASENAEQLKSLSSPAKRRAPHILSVAATMPADLTGKPKASACSFYRDTTGKLILLNEAGREEVLPLEVRL